MDNLSSEGVFNPNFDTSNTSLNSDSYPHYHLSGPLQCDLHGAPFEDHPEASINPKCTSCWQVIIDMSIRSPALDS